MPDGKGGMAYQHAPTPNQPTIPPPPEPVKKTLVPMERARLFGDPVSEPKPAQDSRAEMHIGGENPETIRLEPKPDSSAVRWETPDAQARPRRRTGVPVSVSYEQRDIVIAGARKGKTDRQIADSTGLSTSTVARIRNAAGILKGPRGALVPADSSGRPVPKANMALESDETVKIPIRAQTAAETFNRMRISEASLPPMASPDPETAPEDETRGEPLIVEAVQTVPTRPSLLSRLFRRQAPLEPTLIRSVLEQQHAIAVTELDRALDELHGLEQQIHRAEGRVNAAKRRERAAFTLLHP